jgi:hypothetical protein
MDGSTVGCCSQVLCVSAPYLEAITQACCGAHCLFQQRTRVCCACPQHVHKRSDTNSQHAPAELWRGTISPRLLEVIALTVLGYHRPVASVQPTCRTISVDV